MRIRLPIYTVMHFLVDLTCIYRLYSQIMPLCRNNENWIILVVLYNFLAFALPALVGLLADYMDTSDRMAALGCILVAVPVWLRFYSLPMVVLQGIGNGLFHVGAGRRVLLESKGKYAPSGIFISSGAMGVFLGTVWKHRYSPLLVKGLAGSMLISAAILLIFAIRQKHLENATSQNPAIRKENTGSFLSLPVLMILLVVVLRSLYGIAVSYEWKNTFAIGLIFSCCIVAGKAFGGILADWIGVRKTAILSLGGAALTVLFSEHSVFLGCFSILLFNMTMPLTLSLIAEYWKAYPGFAFGILMMALFIGTLPDLVGDGLTLSMPALCVTACISLIGLLMGIGKRQEGEL